MLVSGAALVAFGATGEGAGVGIAGETGAADGENAGVVTGSSLDTELAVRECRSTGAEACRADFTAGLAAVFAGAAGVAAEGGGVAAAPVCIGCGVGVGVGTESVAAAAGAGCACAVGSAPIGSDVVLLPACTRFQAPSPTAMMARTVAINPVVAARLSDLSWRPVMVTGSSK